MKKHLIILLTLCTFCIMSCDVEVSNKTSETKEDTTNEQTEKSTVYLKEFNATRKVVTAPTIELTMNTDFEKWDKEQNRLEQLPILVANDLQGVEQKIVARATLFQEIFETSKPLPAGLMKQPITLVIHSEEVLEGDKTEKMVDVYYTAEAETVEVFNELLQSATRLDDSEPIIAFNRGTETRPVEIKDNTLKYYQYSTTHNTFYIESIQFKMIGNEPFIKEIRLLNQW